MIGLEDARHLIQPTEEQLIDAHHAASEAWREMLTKHTHLSLPLNRSARAVFIHCHLQSEVSRRVEPVVSVSTTDALGSFALKIGPSVLLRFKYVGHDGTPHNYPTGLQKSLARQTYPEQMILALTGDSEAGPPTLLTCGYTLTDESKINRVEIRRDCTGHLPWSYDIYGGEAVIEPMFIEGMADETKPARVASARAPDKKGEDLAAGG